MTKIAAALFLKHKLIKLERTLQDFANQNEINHEYMKNSKHPVCKIIVEETS